uniref:NADH-ubiquinone oxidoreductase chain 6 n=1 Tax=Johnius borneensis TaxID=499536 RepID=A0A481U8C8_9TELE|nr:NADH dehydrogenase subunit 6 [Johnius borneensis]QBI38044.1 NADH dehydrogenase subunit 6 [Johnius borneensis]
MTYIMSICLFGLVVGVTGVASNPSPYYAAFSLVMLASMGCGLLVGHGGHFLALVLFLIYLGAMLVVFAYSAALAAEPYPESWGNRSVLVYSMAYIAVLTVISVMFWAEWYEASWTPVDELGNLAVLRADSQGVAWMFNDGGGMLLLSAWVLLVALLVVLELTRGLNRGSLRAV